MTQQLEQLAGAYFHQDYGLDLGSPEQVIGRRVGGHR
jgi:hypothetical protein